MRGSKFVPPLLMLKKHVSSANVGATPQQSSTTGRTQPALALALTTVVVEGDQDTTQTAEAFHGDVFKVNTSINEPPELYYGELAMTRKIQRGSKVPHRQMAMMHFA